jgi:hypothetical protein
LIKLLTRAAAAAVLLFVFFIESPGIARGQGVGVYRGRQGRRVGGVTLPTPPFNPNAGILDGRGGRRHDSLKTTRRRSTRRSIKTAAPATPRRRRVRRGRPGRRPTVTNNSPGGMH